ncbi:YicC family protein [Nonlabens sp.]|uniref:YicC family protein n=1 Tax=Nonlabens sp. TaxID=1888209 RepID=UPI003F69C2AA
MITSMTGYGKAVQQLSDKKITVEVRTLNSKNLDLNIRLSSLYRQQELPLRQLVSKTLLRGKVDLSVHVEQTGVAPNSRINLELVENYMRQMSELDGIHFSNGDHKLQLLEIATKFPDVFSQQSTDVSKEDILAIEETAKTAIIAVQEFRKDEGHVLELEFDKRISNIKYLLSQVIEEDVDRLADVRTRLEKAVSEIKEKVDENRFEQELIYYLEKYDITEEKVRLENHLNYFMETMSIPESQGKKLAFISQEIGREVNTIGSKANHAAMQQMVVRMKDELEKIKEQLLNVL